MRLEDINAEYEEKGVVSSEAIEFLKSELRGSNPYPAITVVADCGVFDASEELSACLQSSDAMVRWNAAAALFTRLQNPYYAQSCHELAINDTDELVRAVALCGLGEILRSVSDSEQTKKMASTLLLLIENDSELPELRGAAYEGILAALDVPIEARPPSSRGIDLDRDVDWKRISEFRRQYA